jgi:hypothetical protein
MNADNDSSGEPAQETPTPDTGQEQPRTISDEEFRLYLRRQKRDELRGEAGMPEGHTRWWRFRTKLLGALAYAHPQPSGHERWDQAYQIVRRQIESRADRDFGLVMALLGHHGSGKTELATGLLLLVTAKLQSARYVTAIDLCLQLEAALNSRGETTREAIVEEYRQPRLLVIDDCSASASSESEARCLRAIVDGRYRSNRDTLLVSNDSPAAFAEVCGAWNLDRMRQGGGFIECNWESFRK